MSSPISARKTGRRAIVAAQRRKSALQLRLAGRDFRAIAEQLGYSGPGAAYKAVATAIAQLPRADAEQYVAEQLGRIDHVIEVMAPFAATGDSRAADVILRAEERRSKLLGLDAPARSSVTFATEEQGRRLAYLAELETTADEELAADQFERLAGLLREALAADAERAMDVIATAGLIVGPSDELRRMHRHAG